MNTLFEEIKREKKILENKSFFIVKDRYPLIENHFLLFPNVECASFSQIDITELEAFLTNFIKYEKENYFFFEAGNNTFCSTFEGNYIAHAHLIQSSKLVGFNLQVEKQSIQKIDSLEILRSVNSNDQYLLWGEINNFYNFIHPIQNCTKKFFRTQIKNFISNENN
jgi:diadenosine tetraphosphate (Ap4A) HIT family hydrolase